MPIKDGILHQATRAASLQMYVTAVAVPPLQSTTPRFGVTPFSQSECKAAVTISVDYSEANNSERT